MNYLLIAVIIAAAVAAVLFLKSRGVGRVTLLREAQEKTGAASFKGEYSGIGYTVETYSHDIVTVEIDAPGISRPLEVNARKKRPVALNDDRKTEVEALFGLGADYIDIGFNTGRVAAEFPTGSVKVTRELAEKAVIYLIRLNEKSA